MTLFYDMDAEQKIRFGLVVSAGLWMLGLLLYTFPNVYFFEGHVFQGIAVTVFSGLVFPIIAIKHFYNERSSGREIYVEITSILASVIIATMSKTNPNALPGLPGSLKVSLSVLLVLNLITFGTPIVKDSMLKASDKSKLKDKNLELKLLYTIRVFTGICDTIALTYLFARWYEGSNGVGLILMEGILISWTAMFITDEITGKFQVFIEILTIVGVPLLLAFARPSETVDQDFPRWYKYAILVGMHLVCTNFGIWAFEFKEKLRLLSRKSEEPERPEEETAHDQTKVPELQHTEGVMVKDLPSECTIILDGDVVDVVEIQQVGKKYILHTEEGPSSQLPGETILDMVVE